MIKEKTLLLIGNSIMVLKLMELSGQIPMVFRCKEEILSRIGGKMMNQTSLMKRLDQISRLLLPITIQLTQLLLLEILIHPYKLPS